MNDQNGTALTPAAEDPELHRHLAALAAFTPATLFEDRVLSRVWMPEPTWVRNLRVVGHEWTNTGRVWLVLGALALGGLIPTAVSAGLAVAFSSEIAAGTGWLLQHGLPNLARATVDALETWWVQVVPTRALQHFAGVQGLSTAAGYVVLLVACTWGLRRAMRQDRVR